MIRCQIRWNNTLSYSKFPIIFLFTSLIFINACNKAESNKQNVRRNTVVSVIGEFKGNYYYTSKNGNKYLAPRFDLLEWQLLSPAKRWQHGSGKPVLLSAKDYIDFTVLAKEEPQTFIIAGKYDSGCL